MLGKVNLDTMRLVSGLPSFGMRLKGWPLGAFRGSLASRAVTLLTCDCRGSFHSRRSLRILRSHFLPPSHYLGILSSPLILSVWRCLVVGARGVAIVTSMVMPVDALRAPPFLYVTSSQAQSIVDEFKGTFRGLGGGGGGGICHCFQLLLQPQHSHVTIKATTSFSDSWSKSLQRLWYIPLKEQGKPNEMKM